MISTFCADLKITIPQPLVSMDILNQTGNNPHIWFAEYNNVLSEYKDWLDQLGLVMTYPPLIFYTPAGQDCGIHIDGFNISNRVTMNWIIGGDNDLMHWYSLKPGVEITKQDKTQAGTPYTRYTAEQTELIHSQLVKYPSIVQIGIPHNITNYGNKPRWCLSCDISKKENPETGLTMEEALEVFKKWIA